ncbi:hypothetical protein N7510_006593 [Penicillium lagena]|uniref:uncharacterized protein n=1 Tax=Penicillium lagena TaxID=94218 RepID=UPI0025401088|nr:uncharacterized protein N7510_006593 [Penicillium lagena]KAJ5613399.1 hypothetical protein N7510_006593 [Penicillium lagena]
MSQRDNTQGPGSDAQRKRARRNSSLVEPEACDQNQRNVRDSDQNRTMGSVSGPTSQHPVTSWTSTVAAFERDPMSDQVQRYKDWRRNGSLNEKICRVCLQPGDLYPCRTCRPAFHLRCIPHGSLRDSQNRIFCALCVRRGWNVAPPALTPPSSPGPAPARQLDATTTPMATDTSTRATSIPSLVTGTLESDAHSQFPTVQEGHGITENVSSPNSTDYRALQPRPAAVDIVSQLNIEAPGESSDHNAGTPRPKRQRKSRFATLPTEVDSSLAVLYRELESVASLKAQVEDLRVQNTQHLQVLKIRDNNIASLRRNLDNRKGEAEELARLRTNKFQYDSLLKEIEELRSKNAQLEADLKVSRERTAAAEEIVNDWKGKLTQLIGTS